MNKFVYGTDAAYLGPCTAEKPDLAPGLCGWDNALKIDRFFRANGRPLPSTPTAFYLKWDEDNLYILTVNRENTDNADQQRRDINELFLAGRDFGPSDFAVISANRDGELKAFWEKGMTYKGGMETMGRDQPNGIPFEVIYNTYDNKAEIENIDLSSFKSVVDKGEGYWSVGYEIPWDVIGGRPEEQFRFQLYREKQTSGEISSPTALDEYINLPDWFEYDPLCFIEGHLGGIAGPVKENSVLITLPSGVKRWTRYGIINGAEKGESKKLWDALTNAVPTDAMNVEEHITLVQRLQDIMSTEGLDFYWDNGGSRPFPHKDPWNERHVFNQYMLDGKFDEAYRRLDEYMEFFRHYIGWYYTDGTLGDTSNQWLGYEKLLSAVSENNRILLYFETDAVEKALSLSFADDGVRIKAVNGGGRFDAEGESFTASQTDGYTVYTCGNRSVVVTTGSDWSVCVSIGGREVFVLHKDTLRRVNAEGKDGYQLNIPLAKDEIVYGFGERFDDVNQRGHVVALYQRDAYMAIMAGLANETYKNIPLIHFGSGYTVFINSTYRIRADAGVSDPDALILGINDPNPDFYIWGGTPAENMGSYAKLTGFPMLPPKWAFEPWAGGGSGRWKSGPLGNLVEEQMGVIRKFEELDIPHAAIYAEGASQHGSNSDGEVYRISAFAESKGLHALSWEYSVMDPEQAAAWLGDNENLPITTHPGYTGDKRYVTYIDFTHPRALELLKKQWANRFDANIRGTMVDFGDKIPDEAVFYDGRTGKEMHNGYALDYAKAYRAAFESRYGEDHVFYQRAGAAGCQSYACEFGGDQPMTFLGMKQAMNGGFSVAASGLPYWGVDVCGYDGFAKSDAETYMRWTAWSVFCPIMRYHGTKPKEPWEYTDQVVESYKFYAWLRENLLNYSYSTAVEAHHTGIPMMRLLPLMYPDSRNTQNVTDEYMYGDHLLVAPIYTEDNLRRIVFPEGGRYVNLFNNGEVYDGGVTIEREFPITEIPVYIASGAVLPLRLNENLKPGFSMTKCEKNVLLLTKPVKDTKGSWFGSDTEENKYAFTVSNNGFTFNAKGTGKFEYIIVKGLRDIRGVKLNGIRLEEAPAKQGLYMNEQWITAEDNTLYIRIFMHSDVRLEIDAD